MRIGTIALEENALHEVPPVDAVSPEEQETEQAVAQAEIATNETVEQLGDVQEGADIAETATEITESVQETVNQGDGMSEQTSEIVNSAMEHFYDRLGYKRKRVSAIPAMESFKVKESRLQATKVAVEELQNFSNKLHGSLTVAQEGVFARLGNTLRLVFTSNEKIRERVDQYAADLKSKGSNGKLIKEPGWGRSFAKIGKPVLNGADVIKHTEALTKLLTSAEAIDVMKDITDLLEKLTLEVSKSRFVANDDAVKEIQSLTEKASALRDKIDKLIFTDVRTAKNDPSFQALTPEEGEKIAKTVNTLLNNTALDNARTAMEQAISNTNSLLFTESQTRLLGIYAADLRAVQQLVMKLNPIIGEIVNLSRDRMRTAFAVGKYMKASTAK